MDIFLDYLYSWIGNDFGWASWMLMIIAEPCSASPLLLWIDGQRLKNLAVHQKFRWPFQGIQVLMIIAGRLRLSKSGESK
jgi:hypothetical protein